MERADGERGMRMRMARCEIGLLPKPSPPQGEVPGKSSGTAAVGLTLPGTDQTADAKKQHYRHYGTARPASQTYPTILLSATFLPSIHPAIREGGRLLPFLPLRRVPPSDFPPASTCHTIRTRPHCIPRSCNGGKDGIQPCTRFVLLVLRARVRVPSRLSDLCSASAYWRDDNDVRFFVRVAALRLHRCARVFFVLGTDRSFGRGRTTSQTHVQRWEVRARQQTTASQVGERALLARARNQV